MPNCTPMADGGMRKCSAAEGSQGESKTSRGEGLVPRRGRGGAQQNPPRQFAVLSHNSGPSEFVIPAIESMPRTPIRGRESTH